MVESAMIQHWKTNNVKDQMMWMIVWPSTESHDSTKVRLIGFDKLIGFQGNESQKKCLGLDKWW